MMFPGLVAAAIVILMLGVGAWMTTVGPWYRDLRKPAWNPPDWIFGPAWTVILALAGWAGVSAWTNASSSADQFRILTLFGINVLLHMLWSPLFFNQRRPDWALIEVPFLWLSIVALMVGLAHMSRLAAIPVPALGDVRRFPELHNRPDQWFVRPESRRHGSPTNALTISDVQPLFRPPSAHALDPEPANGATGRQVCSQHQPFPV